MSPKCGGVVKDNWKKLWLLILLIVSIMMLWVAFCAFWR